MNIENWNLYYKTHETKLIPTTTQRCYEPLVNPEGNVFCMNFCFPCDYQANQPRLAYNQEFVDQMFDREIKYLSIFKDASWAPEVLDISDKKIFIRWYGKTCNDNIYKSCDLNPKWKSHIEEIILDQVNAGYLKCSLYPHSHYYDNSGQMRSIDFYATIEKDNPCMTLKEISGLIGDGPNPERFDSATDGNNINIEKIFKSGLLKYSHWPKNLTSIHKTIYGTVK